LVFFPSKTLVLLLPQITLFIAWLRVVCSSHEKSGLGVGVGCRDTACCCSYSRGAAAGESLPIGYLSNTDAATDSARAEGIRLALRELGYIEGQNIAIEYRYAEGKVDRAPELAAELVRLKVDAIVVAGGTPSVQSAMNATKTIPIVMMGQGSDPVRAGHVESLARRAATSPALRALPEN
jgi:hypothetical protein